MSEQEKTFGNDLSEAMEYVSAEKERWYQCREVCEGVEFSPGASVRDLVQAARGLWSAFHNPAIARADLEAALAKFKLKEEKKDG